MPSSESRISIPSDYRPLAGSERHPSPSARLVGPTDPQERLSVTIVLRRRPDAEPIPDFEHFRNTHPSQRRRLPEDEFVQRYGASPEDLQRVVRFAVQRGLVVEETNAARRTVVADGTVEQMSRAFAVSLDTYEHTVTPGRAGAAVTERYRGRDGLIHLPKALTEVVLAVLGLDNRRVVETNGADPPNTAPLPIETIRQLYNFPTNSASGQTIAIFSIPSMAGYKWSDIAASFEGSPPSVRDVTVDASNSGQPGSGETTWAIVIAAKAAPGAAIAVYFTTNTQQGYVDLINRVVHPQDGDPVCSVLSSSFYAADGDDAATLQNKGASTCFLTAISKAFQDAAIQGLTICVPSGDTGTNSKVPDGKAHVQYPGSDPWVLSVGGTTIGNVVYSSEQVPGLPGLPVFFESFEEYVWNDPDPSDRDHWGTTGGGVSDFFPLPSYQRGAGVPASINDSTHTGRGVPDVAANASLNAGYTGIISGGTAQVVGGTSVSAPLWAALIAVINAALEDHVGFINPILYAIAPAGFRDITGAEGPADNSNGGTPGYPAGVGWDACTGWGSPNGVELLNALSGFPRVAPDPGDVPGPSGIASR